ncbi:MAG: phage holin family protein [Candidatus Omnitrophica bacterium]|nr:phage holin family protein [Candidatus Omnitrophota bacterium]MDD5737469.1 phage holin family protein [Candidatus Omnitrophota bacterium]
MRGFVLTWIVNIAAMVLVISVVPGIHSESRLATVLAALVLGLINATLRPVVFAMTLPLTIFSFGIFTLFMNGFFFYIVSWVVEGFVIADFSAAFWGALCFSVISFMLNLIISPQGGFKVYHFGGRSNRESRVNTMRDRNIIDVEAEVDNDDEEGKDGPE